MTSDDILDLRELPKSLAVMGGGVVGIELGLVYASYGVEVTVVSFYNLRNPNRCHDLHTLFSKDFLKFK